MEHNPTAQTGMRYRLLGDSGLRVSEIGFGAWGIGGSTPGATSYGQTDDAESCAALERALDLGINFVDTSSVYGHGHSERLIGRVFAAPARRHEAVIATKAGVIDYAAPPDFSAPAIRTSVETSLQNLKTDYIDLLQLHNPSAEWLADHPDTGEVLSRLRQEGKVRAVGVSVKKPADALPLLALFPFQSIQANFNMLDIRALEGGLLEELALRRVGFIARTPMSFGFLAGSLTGEETFAPDDHRSSWPRAQIRLWASGAKDLYEACVEAPAIPRYEAALRFCLSYPQVSTAIAGMLTPTEVQANALASSAGPLSAVSCARIEAMHRERSFVAR